MHKRDLVCVTRHQRAVKYGPLSRGQLSLGSDYCKGVVMNIRELVGRQRTWKRSAMDDR